MTEEEKMKFWGDLVEPMTALLGGLLVRGEYKLVDVVKDIVDKAENAALEEREACAKVAEERFLAQANCTVEEMYELQKKVIAENIRARGQE
jgi:hypothetical protein